MALVHLDRLGVVWTPPAGAFPSSPLGRMAARYDLTDAAAVHRRAALDPNWYWEAAAEDVGVRWLRPYEAVVDLTDGMEQPRYFASGRLNWADFAVDRWVDVGRGAAPAIDWEGDDGAQRRLTYAELKDEVDRAAGALEAAGVAFGATVGIVLPMVPEAVVAMLAVAKIGAIAVPMFSGYGPSAIRERMVHAGARHLVTADAFPRRGRRVELKATIDEAIAGLPIDRVLVVRRLGGSTTDWAPARDRWWDEELAAATPRTRAVAMDADDPCLLLFTSGSTGSPKGCIHTHAGLPFKLAAEARHGMGLDETGRLLWLTDMGWVMGSYVVAAALGNGATAVLFEGTPDWPEPDRLWAVAARTGVTVLGISPTVVRSLMRHGDEWPARHALEGLRAIGSTGEPWNLGPWMWCFRHIARERTPIVNISGGTECGGSLLSGSTVLPVKPMAFAGPTLGVSSDVVDEDGRPVRGDVGELVVRAPWPGMTRSLWRDPERYFESYWHRYPGLWHQGDFGYVDPDGHWYLLGRSDDTMNVAGKRVGPAEVESALVRDEDVVEAAAVGVPDDLKGEGLVAFVVVRDGVDVDAITGRLVDLVKADLGPAIAPKRIVAVDALPKTRSGKVLRRVVRAVYLGLPVGDLSTIDDATVLDGLPTAAGSVPDAVPG